jgi:hypothetical protein
MPLFTLDQARAGIRAISTGTQGGEYLEVFNQFLSITSLASEGIYVARVYQADRTTHTGGITPGGRVYLIKDRIEMYLMTSQDNPYVDNLLGIFPTFLDNALFNGYFQREHTIEQIYGNNNEQYKIIFDLTRLQLI